MGSLGLRRCSCRCRLTRELGLEGCGCAARRPRHGREGGEGTAHQWNEMEETIVNSYDYATGSPVGAGAFASTRSPPITSRSPRLEQRRCLGHELTGNEEDST